MELNQSRANQAAPKPAHQGEDHHATHTSNLQLPMVAPNAFDSGSQAFPEKTGADIALENSTTAPKKNTRARSQKKKPASQTRRRKAKVFINHVFDLPEQFQEWLDAPPKRLLRLNPEQQIWFWKATGPDCFKNMDWDRCSQEFFKTYGVKWDGSRLLMEWYRVERKMRIAARVNGENEIIREGKLRRAKNAKAATEALNITQTPEILSTTMKLRNHIGQDDQEGSGVTGDCQDLVGSYAVGALEPVSSTEHTFPNPPTGTIVSQEKNRDISVTPALLRPIYPQMAADEPIADSALRNLNISGQQVVPTKSPSRIKKTYMRIGYPMREDAQHHSKTLPGCHSRPPAIPHKSQILMQNYRTDLDYFCSLTVKQPAPVVIEDHIASIHEQVVNRYLEVAAPTTNSAVQDCPKKSPIMTTYPLPITTAQNKPLRVYTYSASMGRVCIDAEMWFSPSVSLGNLRPSHATTCTEGLGEIIQVLTFTPVQRNVIIISDSREAIYEFSATRKLEYRMCAQQNKVVRIGPFLHKIFQFLGERERMGSSTTFEWIQGVRGR